MQTADNGPDAVKAGIAMQPDVVLHHIGCPGMDGDEVAGQLRRDPRTAGYGSEEERQGSTPRRLFVGRMSQITHFSHCRSQRLLELQRRNRIAIQLMAGFT